MVGDHGGGLLVGLGIFDTDATSECIHFVRTRIGRLASYPSSNGAEAGK